MDTGEIIALIAVSLVICLAAAYIVIAKKKGKKCIGCPDSAVCSSKKCGGDCSLCNSCYNESSEGETTQNGKK